MKVITAVNKKSYDIILMDIQIPKMDGYEATKKIRSSNEAYKHTPIIAMKEDKGKCLATGMNEYIPKPTEPDHLSRTISTLLI